MWRSSSLLILIGATVASSLRADISTNATDAPYGFAIPASHPRLWWTPERIARAKKFAPGGDDPFSNAMNYVLSGRKGYARAAIGWLMAYRIPQPQLDGVASDNARWDGENAALTYDWCNDQMTADERETIVKRWNGYFGTLSKKGWGGVGLEANNYYWGYLRNELEWGIATWGDNPQAKDFLGHALVTRWKNSFLPYASGNGRGGVLAEGPGYGAVLPWYSLIPFQSMRLLGRDPYEETPFFKEVVFYLIYSTTPAPTVFGNGGYSTYHMFLFNDTEDFGQAPMFNSRKYYGDFMTVFANQWGERPIGEYARRWLNLVKPSVSGFVQAVNTPGKERDFGSLPLDYFAPGIAYLYARNQWGPQATVVHLSLGYPEGVGHSHRDFSTFQVWRNGRWLTRESTGYSQNITGYNGGQIDCSFPEGHNGVLIGPRGDIKPLESRGVARAHWKGHPLVQRLESRPNYSYAAVDLTPCFKAVEYPEMFENPYVKSVVREFLFVRSIETMVVLDRIESAAHGKARAEDSVKTFLIHFEQKPEIQGDNSVLARNGNQALQLTTLVPAKPEYRVVNEGGAIGQHRLEVATSGQAQSYLLHVLQARGAKDPNVTAQLTEDDSSFKIALQHPTKGKVEIVLGKGMKSAGGSVDGAPLTDKVQQIEVTNDGPVWK